MSEHENFNFVKSTQKDEEKKMKLQKKKVSGGKKIAKAMARVASYSI